MKKLLLLSALFIFSCSDDDSSDTNDNNATNPSLEKRISQMGIHDISLLALFSTRFVPKLLSFNLFLCTSYVSKIIIKLITFEI